MVFRYAHLRECGGEVKVIASIEDPVVIRKILAHLDKKRVLAGTSLLPDCRMQELIRD